MKNFTTLLLSIFLCFSASSQELIGAWIEHEQSNDEIALKTIITFTEGYQVWTTYDIVTGAFLSSQGGSWKLNNQSIEQYIEFDSENPNTVGHTFQLPIEFKNDNKLYFPSLNKYFKRIDDGKPGKLMGTWLMSGRVVEGKEFTRDTSNPRKTMKILSGTLFQWIAYDTEKKSFIATGGGTYSTINGEYIEHIQFFSRDSTRVGMNLKFNYKLTEDGTWEHTGLSSKGDPINEKWNLRTP